MGRLQIDVCLTKRLHANAAIALLFHAGRQWRGVSEPCRSMKDYFLMTLISRGMFLVLVVVFGLTVACVNRPPTISKVSHQDTNENMPKTIPFSVTDPDTPFDQLQITALSGNPAVVPASGIVFKGDARGCTLTVRPAAHNYGRTKITITASDGHSQATETFEFVVNPINGDGIIIVPIPPSPP